MKLCHKFEISGLVLLLASFGWEFFVIGFNEKIITSTYQDHIVTRLDEIHSRQYLLQKNLNAVTEQIANGTPVGASYLMKEKFMTLQQQDNGKLSESTDGFKNFRAFIFILASLLMIVGKFLEHSSKPDT
ncbi:hypothetical protein [Pseudoalteromonas piscicida]